MGTTKSHIELSQDYSGDGPSQDCREDGPEPGCFCSFRKVTVTLAL